MIKLISVNLDYLNFFFVYLCFTLAFFQLKIFFKTIKLWLVEFCGLLCIVYFISIVKGFFLIFRKIKF